MPFRTWLASAAVLLVAGTAAAQPGAAEPPPPPPAPTPAPAIAPPPQNYDWNELSHINGQLVKVGERNEYIIKFRKTNISANPMGWILGFYGLSVSHALSDNIAIRGDLNFMKPVGTTETGFELGAALPIYLRRTYQGPFLEPGVIVRTWHDTHTEYDYDANTGESRERTVEGSATTLGPQVLVGWHWTWDSGFNLALAAGVGRNLNASGDDYYDAEEEIFVNGYMRFGYAF